MYNVLYTQCLNNNNLLSKLNDTTYWDVNEFLGYLHACTILNLLGDNLIYTSYSDKNYHNFTYDQTNLNQIKNYISFGTISAGTWDISNWDLYTESLSSTYFDNNGKLKDNISGLITQTQN